MTAPTDHDLPPLNATPPGLYRHYKGGWYEVIDTVRCSETLQGMTVYRALYGPGLADDGGGLWVRPAAMSRRRPSARASPWCLPSIAWLIVNPDWVDQLTVRNRHDSPLGQGADAFGAGFPGSVVRCRFFIYNEETS